MISNRKVTYDSFLAKEDINYSNVFLPGIVACLIHGIDHKHNKTLIILKLNVAM